LIEAVGASKVITVDLHSEAVASFFNVSVAHLFGLSIFLPEIRKLRNDLVIIAPDAGGAKRAQKFAEEIDAPLALIEKKRNLQKLHTLESLAVIGEVSGKTCVIVDEVITGGGTVVEAARLLKEKGAKKVIACATHPDFVEGTAEKLTKSEVDKVYVSDTIPIKSKDIFPKLKIVSIGNLIAETIRNL
ncbi:ribose-phosphate pyrophosphokinase, partial [Candidatus Gottesmanbacteria bacterium]|nr:ribose-phosphate pyrophosphokinase [Candidatus Gottesmanbacteria bacterium]